MCIFTLRQGMFQGLALLVGCIWKTEYELVAMMLCTFFSNGKENWKYACIAC